MGNRASKLKGNPAKGLQHAVPRSTLPPAQGARPPPEPPVQPAPSAPTLAAAPAPPTHVRASRTAPTVAEYQNAEIIKDGLDPDLAAAPEPQYASHLADLGPVSVGKPRIRLARNERMLAILARRKRESFLDPTEHRPEGQTEQLDGPSVPPGSRSRRSTRLEVPALLDLLSARAHATEPYHIEALAKEFGLDPPTLLALGRRFGAPREVEQIVDSAPENSGKGKDKAQAKAAPSEKGPDLASTPIGGESALKQTFLVWADVPEVKMPSP